MEGYQLRLPPVNNPLNPLSPWDLAIVPIVFMFTFLFEGMGLWFLINKFLKPNPRFKPRQVLILVLIVNTVTFFLGNYVLLPLLKPEWIPYQEMIAISFWWGYWLIVGFAFMGGVLLGIFIKMETGTKRGEVS